MTNKSKKKHIALLIPSLIGGGAERVISILANQLALDESYRVSLVTLESGQDFELNPSINRVIFSKLYGRGTRFLKVLSYPYYFYRLLAFVFKHRPDAVIAFLNRAIILNILVSFFANYRTISSIRSFTSKQLEHISGYLKFLYKNCFKILLNRSYKVVCVSEGSMNDIVENFNVNEDKAVTICNPYDLNRTEKLSQEALPEQYREFFSSSRVIVTLGRLIKSKNHAQLIDMFHELSSKYPDIKLCILGSGAQEKDLREKISFLELNDRVILGGYHRNPLPFIKNSCLFAFTSVYEGFPNCLVEAMACKIPVVSYDCQSGPAEILLNNEYGFLVKLNDRNEFKKKIEILLNDPEVHKNYSKLGYKRAQDFSLETFMEKFKRVIDE